MAPLETAKSWLEAALTAWQGLNDARRLEMIAASLLSLNELEMGLSNLRLEPAAAGQRPDDLRIAVTSERPSLADLTMMPSNGERVALVKLVIRDQPLVGKSVCHPGLGVDHAARASHARSSNPGAGRAAELERRAGASDPRWAVCHGDAAQQRPSVGRIGDDRKRPRNRDGARDVRRGEPFDQQDDAPRRQGDPTFLDTRRPASEGVHSAPTRSVLRQLRGAIASRAEAGI